MAVTNCLLTSHVPTRKEKRLPEQPTGLPANCRIFPRRPIRSPTCPLHPGPAGPAPGIRPDRRPGPEPGALLSEPEGAFSLPAAAGGKLQDPLLGAGDGL